MINDTQYVFLAGYESDVGRANFKIARIIAEEFVRRGHSVCVLLVGKAERTYVESGVMYKVITAPESLKYKDENESFFLKLYREYQALKQRNCYPARDPWAAKALAEHFAGKHNNIENECVIAFSKPFFNTSAASLIKKAFPGIKCCEFILDLFDDLGNEDPVSRKNNIDVHFGKAMKYRRRLDILFVPPTGASYFEKKLNDTSLPQTVCLDFPTMVPPPNILEETQFNDGKKHFLVYGSVDLGFRDPTRLLDLAGTLPSELDCEFDFFCKGCEKLLRQAAAKFPERIKLFDRVDYPTLQKLILSADAVVNISNESSIMVPSKLFEIFAYGKPVIDISKDGENSSKSYLDRYPNVLKLFSCEPLEISTEKFICWINSQPFKQIPFETVEKIYHKNTVEYVANEILEYTNPIQ